MANNKKTRKAAQVALSKYRSIPGFRTDEETAISDLIADLMHLADSKNFSGEYLAEKAHDDYLSEIEEKNER